MTPDRSKLPIPLQGWKDDRLWSFVREYNRGDRLRDIGLRRKVSMAQVQLWVDAFVIAGFIAKKRKQAKPVERTYAERHVTPPAKRTEVKVDRLVASSVASGVKLARKRLSNKGHVVEVVQCGGHVTFSIDGGHPVSVARLCEMGWQAEKNGSVRRVK